MTLKAIELFNEIQDPDEVISTLIFNACAQLETSEALLLVKRGSTSLPKICITWSKSKFESEYVHSIARVEKPL